MKSIQRYNRSMTNYNSINSSNKSSGYILEMVRNGEVVSQVDLHIDGNYLVEPENPKKLKHRGRHCTILEFELDKIKSLTERCKVRFHDNNRIGMVNFTDLKSI
ncbi:hypothetical protein [Paenibacillus dendritiformis]|uniref:hypothetical protein n=1 Tax=Paenibacillus dendritiformis TaxID=130049 RepID=UPI00387E1F2F